MKNFVLVAFFAANVKGDIWKARVTLMFCITKFSISVTSLLCPSTECLEGISFSFETGTGKNGLS